MSSNSRTAFATPFFVTVLVMALTGLLVSLQGRIHWCACGHWHPWTSSVVSAHNSQHLFDPYSFTHIAHGLLLFLLLQWLAPHWSLLRRYTITLAVEGAWEVLENTAWIIHRYREATLSLGYAGDSVLNSMADVLCCALGFGIAWKWGRARTVALFAAMELALLVTVRDNLTLNILMLICPIESIKTWQMAA